MKLTIDFDDYEAALLRKVRQELRAVARRHGKKPPGMKDVIRGAVRMGVHSIYGEGIVSEGILSGATYPELIQGSVNDSSQSEGDSDDDDT